jgi:opacity protein-like surface antigen
MLRSTLLVILFAFSGVAFADDFNYNQVTVSYGQIDLDDIDADGDVIRINGSAAVSETFHVFAGYGVGEVDNAFGSADIDQWNVGLGYNTTLSESVDLVVGLSYEYLDVDEVGFPSTDDSGFGLGVGLRMAASEKLEITAGISYVDYSDFGDNTAFSGGLLYGFTENFSLGLNARVDDDITEYSIGGRFYFGN